MSAVAVVKPLLERDGYEYYRCEAGVARRTVGETGIGRWYCPMHNWIFRQENSVYPFEAERLFTLYVGGEAVEVLEDDGPRIL